MKRGLQNAVPGYETLPWKRRQVMPTILFWLMIAGVLLFLSILI